MNIQLNETSGDSYNLFYAASIILAVIILIRQGKNHKLHFRAWLLTWATCLIAFIIGCTLITLNQTEWKSVLTDHLLKSQHVGASMLGGLLFSIPVILLCRYLYSFDGRMLDAFAFVLPAGMAVQRIGCLLAGCCYGNVTEHSWAVTYKSHLGSIALHPVQLYESAGCLLTIMAIHFSARSFKRPGSLFLFSGLCYALVRFACEFFRIHEIDSVTAKTFFGLNTVQYAMLILITISGAIILLLESGKNNTSKNSTSSISQRSLLIHLLVLVTTVIFFSPFVRRFDVIIVLALVSMSCGVFLWNFYRRQLMARRSSVTIATLLILSVVLMSQQSTTSSQHYKTIKTYNTVSIGSSAQQLDLVKQTATTSGDCGTTPVFTYFNIKNTTGAVSLARTWAKENNVEYTLGLNTYVSSVKEEITGASVASHKFNFVGFNPNFVATTKSVEVTVGAHIGNLRRIKTDLDPTTNQLTAVGRSSIYPQLGLRIGNTKKFFVNAQVYNSPFGVMPSSPFAIGGGSGFGSKRGNYVELGHSSFSLVYFASKFAIDERIYIKPFIGLGTGLNRLDNNQKGFTFAVQLSAKFNQKEKSK